MSHTKKPSFLEHLTAACRRPVNMPIFLDGYQEVLNGIAAAGRFHLYGLTIDAPAGVYSPHDTSSSRAVMDRFFALGLNQPAGRRFLEVGCGAGAISLLAARQGWSVSAGDIDPAAVQATKDNARLNGVHVDARVSDLFAAFAGEEFDVILSTSRSSILTARPAKTNARCRISVAGCTSDSWPRPKSTWLQAAI